MFNLFKKPVAVQCADLQEVENVLTWLRHNDYLANMSKTSYRIVANTNGPLTSPVVIESFTVYIPYDLAIIAMKPFTIEQSFASIKKFGHP